MLYALMHLALNNIRVIYQNYHWKDRKKREFTDLPIRTSWKNGGVGGLAISAIDWSDSEGLKRVSVHSKNGRFSEAG